jgi:hypothetical protein
MHERASSYVVADEPEALLGPFAHPKRRLWLLESCLHITVSGWLTTRVITSPFECSQRARTALYLIQYQIRPATPEPVPRGGQGQCCDDARTCPRKLLRVEAVGKAACLCEGRSDHAVHPYSVVEPLR